MTEKIELFGRCPHFTTQKILGGKWTLLILFHLQNKTLRFSELKKLIPDITQASLTNQLRELEHYGMVIRTVYPVVPPKVEYELSEMGKEFSGSLDSIRSWGIKYISNLNK